MEKLNNALLLKYLMQEGRFNPENYEGILELGSAANDSLSKYLAQYYNQYLLSEKVDYNELNELHIKGAYGYLDSCGICVPKSFYNDQHFIYDAPKAPYIRHGYDSPTIQEFDTIICSGISDDLEYVRNFTHDIYLGYCADLDIDNLEKVKTYRAFFKYLLNYYKSINKDVIMLRDIDTKNSKEYCLIKNK